MIFGALLHCHISVYVCAVMYAIHKFCGLLIWNVLRIIHAIKVSV